MSEDIEKHILRKYEVSQKLGKGVRGGCALCRVAPCVSRSCSPAHTRARARASIAPARVG